MKEKKNKSIKSPSPCTVYPVPCTLYPSPFPLPLSPFTLLLALMLLCWSCTDDSGLVERQWEQVWQDEFDIPGAPDAGKWTYDTGDGGWGNSESQTYTDNPENVTVEDGILKITAIKNGDTANKNGDDEYTSARIKTQGHFDWTYGRFEARIKLPYGPGLWPAFWMLGADIDSNPWPGCGEIDIMEGKGGEPDRVSCALHGGYPQYSVSKTYGLQNARFDNEYHIFAVEWTENGIDFFVDGTLYNRVTPDDVAGEWVFNRPFFIILNVAVGGTFPGYPTDNTPFPQTMHVDYVRVYKEKN